MLARSSSLLSPGVSVEDQAARRCWGKGGKGGEGNQNLLLFHTLDAFKSVEEPSRQAVSQSVCKNSPK